MLRTRPAFLVIAVLTALLAPAGQARAASFLDRGNRPPGGRDESGPGTRPATAPAADAASAPAPAAIVRDSVEDEPEVRQAARAARIAAYKRDVTRLDEHTSLFAWSHTASVMIFWVTHVLLVLGTAAAGLEFYAAFRQRRLAQDGPGDAPTEVELGLQKVALKTSLHGLLILLAVFGFYFLYLKFVYAIVPV